MLVGNVDDFPGTLSDEEEFRRIELGRTVVVRRKRVPPATANNNIVLPSNNFDSKPSRALLTGSLGNRKGPITAVTAFQPNGANRPQNSKAIVRVPSATNGRPRRSLSQGTLSEGPQNKISGASMDLRRQNSQKNEFGTSITGNQKRFSGASWGSSSTVKPVIMNRAPSIAPRNLDHVRKSNTRVNVTFDNARQREIERANSFLAERIQKTKPTYSRLPEEPRIIRSRFELQQSKEFFALQRDNTRIANRIVLAKPTVPSGTSRPQSAAMRLSRSSSSLSNFDISSRSPSNSSLYSKTTHIQRRPEWNDRW